MNRGPDLARVEIPHLLEAMEQATAEHETYLNERIVRDLWQRYFGDTREIHPAAGTVGAHEIAEVIVAGQTRTAAFDAYMESIGWRDLSDARDFAERERVCAENPWERDGLREATCRLEPKVVGALCRARRQGLVERTDYGWVLTFEGDMLLQDLELVA